MTLTPDGDLALGHKLVENVFDVSLKFLVPENELGAGTVLGGADHDENFSHSCRLGTRILRLQTDGQGRSSWLRLRVEVSV